MTLISIVLTLFIVLEILNVILLYFKPSSTKGNAMGFFKVWEASKEMPDVHRLLRYLVYWVAGTKLIFIALLVVIITFADAKVQLYSTVVLIVSIMTFYWKLYPIIKLMDEKGELAKKGYARELAIMIAVFIGMFVIALIVSL
jgi:hypothetical protein